MPGVDFQVLGTPRSCQVLHEPDCIVHWPRPSVFHQPGQWGNILLVPRVFTHLKFNDMMDGCFWMGTLLCSWWYSQLIILVSLMWPSIHPGFLMRLERSKSGFHLHQGWRVRAFMFYGFPRANSRWQDDGGRNRKPVHGTFSRDSKVTSTSPLSRLGPSPPLFYWDQLIVYVLNNKTNELHIRYKFLKAKPRTIFSR